jgi:hypothetical protein
MADHHSVSYRLDAGADVGNAVHLHQAIGAPAGHAEQAPGPVVLEAAAEYPHARRIQGRRYGVAQVGPDRLAVELELNSAGTVDCLCRVGREAVRL